MTDKRIERSYSEEDITAGLTALATWNGNTRRAAEALKEQGREIPRSTLRNWLKHPDHAARYSEIRKTYVPQVRAKMAEEHEDLALEGAAAAKKMLRKLVEEMDHLKPTELSNALRNLVVGLGINTDKASVLRDKPSEIVEHRSADDPLRKLNQALPGLVVDGTAEDLTTDMPALSLTEGDSSA